MKNSLKTLFVALTVTTALVNVASASDGLGGYVSRENVTREVESFVERVNGGADVGKAFDALSEAGKYEAASNDVYRTMVKVKQRLPFARIADAYLSEGSRHKTAIDVRGDVGASKLSLEEARRRDAEFDRTAVDVRGDVASRKESLEEERRRAGLYDRTAVDVRGDVADARRRILESSSTSRAASPKRERADSIAAALQRAQAEADSASLVRSSSPRVAEEEARGGGGFGGSGVSAADFAESRAASATTSRDEISNFSAYAFNTDHGIERLLLLLRNADQRNISELDLHHIGLGFRSIKKLGYTADSLGYLHLSLEDSLWLLPDQKKFLSKFKSAAKVFARSAQDFGGLPNGYEAAGEADEERAAAFMRFVFDVMIHNLKIAKAGFEKSGIEADELIVIQKAIDRFERAKDWLRS